MESFTEKIHLSLGGASHEKELTARLSGIPAGVVIDGDKLSEFMKRRSPGGEIYSSSRKEEDRVIFRRGVKDGRTTGDIIELAIENTDVRSSDYEKFSDIPRPSHADYASYLKYGKIIPGGGSFSGRMTAPLCAAGFIALCALENFGITVGAHIESIGGICDRRFDDTEISKDELEKLKKTPLPVLGERAKDEMMRAISEAKADGDSLGGVIECAAVGVPAGVGDILFGNLESRISSLVFTVPAVKGIEFGIGFAAADIRGSENNDPFITDGERIYTKTNNCGGILGGITTGMPLVFRVAVKPTPSISTEQDSISLCTMTNEKLTVSGRHDTCIVPRALPAIEACAAIALFDAILSGNKETNI